MGQFFTIGELSRSQTADRNGIRNEPNSGHKINLNKLIDNVLDPLRSAYGKPIYVNSGYRCETLNKLVGGANGSQHTRGMAADITAGSKEENKKLFDLVQQLGLEFDQLISEQTSKEGCAWVHVSYNEDFNRNQILYL